VSKIEVGRWGELLKRISGIAGAFSVAGEISPEVSPTMQLEDLADADYLFLKSVRLCAAGRPIVAAAGFTSKFRLRNPATSGVVAVVRGLEIGALNAAINVIGALNQQTVDFSTSILTTAMDTRWGTTGGLNQTALIFSSANDEATVPAGDQIFDMRLDADTPWPYPWQIPLLPGSALDFGTTSANLNIRGWVRWTERGLPELER